MKQKIKYILITVLFIIVSIEILHRTELFNNVALSKAIELVLILYLFRLSYGLILYIRKQYSEKKYSYDIIMNLGLLIFININIFRQLNLLIVNSTKFNIKDIYNNTLESFSYFEVLTLPCILILSIYAIITNIILIKKEGLKNRNLLGIFLGCISIVGLFGSQTVYYLNHKLLAGTDDMVIIKTIDVFINITLSYLYTLIIATLYCNIRAAKHIPKYDQDFIIILGSKIKEDGTLTPLLKGRVDKAIEFAKNQKENTNKDIYYIPSGGKGSDECLSEAAAIKNYLLEKGIDKNHIIIENKSTSTKENMKFSKDIINNKKKNANTCFSTTNYHVFRSGVIASECGLECEGMGSKTKWYYYTNALIREFIANLVQERRKHGALLIIIYLFALIFIYIGFHYDLINLTIIK